MATVTFRFSGDDRVVTDLDPEDAVRAVRALFDGTDQEITLMGVENGVVTRHRSRYLLGVEVTR